MTTDKGEVGGSSPPRPTIIFNGLPRVAPKTSTHNPTHTSLHRIRTDSERHQIFPLRRACFVTVFLCVQVERGLNLGVTQDSLHRVPGELIFSGNHRACNIVPSRHPTSLAPVLNPNGDAWLLEPGDHLAVPLARQEDPLPVYIEETYKTFTIAWLGTYRIEGKAFLYSEQNSGRVRTILGYPIRNII